MSLRPEPKLGLPRSNEPGVRRPDTPTFETNGFTTTFELEHYFRFMEHFSSRSNHGVYDTQHLLILKQRLLTTNGAFKAVNLETTCHSDVSRLYKRAFEEIIEGHLDNTVPLDKRSGQFFLQDDLRTDELFAYMEKFNAIQNVFIRHFASGGFQMVYQAADKAGSDRLASMGGRFLIQPYPARAEAALRSAASVLTAMLR
jgi:hypothetical protein